MALPLYSAIQEEIQCALGVQNGGNTLVPFTFIISLSSYPLYKWALLEIFDLTVV